MRPAPRFILLVVATVALGLFGVLYLLDDNSPEAQVRLQLKTLGETLQKNGPEGAAAMLSRYKTFTGLFGDPVTFSGEASLLTGKRSVDELTGHVFRLRKMFSTLDLSFSNVSVTIEGKTALVRTLITVDMVSKDGHRAKEERSLIAHLVEEDGTWLFQEFEVARNNPDNS